MSQTALRLHVKRDSPDSRPAHHVAPSQTSSTWSSYLPASWDLSAGSAKSRGGSRETAASGRQDVTGFRNPWPSWHRPTQRQIWEALEWGPDQDPSIQLAASHLSEAELVKPGPGRRPNFSNIDDWPRSTGAQAAQLLRSQQPDFEFISATSRAKTTWLGHASVLLQFAPLTGSGEPLRCLFDPVFSMRCSPSQVAGPIRSYAPPCSVEDLPPIDIVMISHNHYDHLDYDTVMSIWRLNHARVRFLVPLGNQQWFVDCGIPEDRVTELDWWDSAHLTSSASDSQPLKIWCTPAQHSSGRGVADADSTLWSGWYLEHPGPRPYRVFFAGDTGYQFHDSPDWPPSPPSRPPYQKLPADPSEDAKFPACPIFAEIRDRLGPPHLAILPIAVGATYSYFRGFAYLPDSISPFPRHRLGLTAAVHMPVWDAVRVLRILTEGCEEPAVAVAMHWGTFVTDPVEVLKTLGQLEWACLQQSVRYGRKLPLDEREEACFIALDHGQSIVT